MSRLLCFASLFIALAIQGTIGATEWLTRTPAHQRYVERDPKGTTILPNGRIITPMGEMIRVQPHPYGLTRSADGRWVVAVSSDDDQLTLLDLKDPANPAVHFIPEHPGEGDGVLDAAFMGVAVAPDNRTLYVAGANYYNVSVFDLETREKLKAISCRHRADGKSYRFGYIGDLRLRSDGKMLYACDQSNFRLLIIDVETEEVRSIAVGRYPFGVALSPDETRAYVANVGMFEYSFLRNEHGRIAKLPFPPFGTPSKEAEEGVTIDGVTAEGLGDPNDIRGMSVWTVDISRVGEEKVVSKAKTGHLVGEQLEDFPAVGGSSPNSMAATEDKVYVSNGSNDSITVLDATTGERTHDIDLILDPRCAKLRGMIPFGVALSPDKKLLYVAEAGINAIGVIRLEDEEVLGHIPTAWFPSKLAVSDDGNTLFVSCAKGIGSGPSAGPGHVEGDPTGIGALMRGYINIIPIGDIDYAAMSAKVVENNVDFYPRAEDTREAGHPVPPAPGTWESPIKHVIYVTKENRTYDEVFGARAQGRGSPEFCRLGKPIDVSNRDGSQTVKDVVLMPNHLALADRFAISDNFYCDSDHSTDGHRWLVGVYMNEFAEAKLGEDAGGRGPGNALFIGSSGAVYPEDYNEGGAVWEHLHRGNIPFWNFGLGFEFKPQDEEQEYTNTGVRMNTNYPMPKVLFERTSRIYATYNTNIPDQFRMDMFKQEFEEKWLSGKEPFPGVVTVMLPNDHGSGDRPEDGYPYWGSYMSDNDLALGRLVELISHSPFWKETVIFVTEDDAQGYVDTVDAHRSVCMAIGPWIKPDYVSSTHASMASILKTIFLIHGLGPLNQYDGLTADLHDMFLTVPENAEPYNAVPVNQEIFDPQKAFDPFDREFNWEAINDFVPMDDPEFLKEDDYGNAGSPGHGPRE